MEFDFSWIIIGFPIAFALGWFASRMDLRQMRLENREDPKSYFKGLNYLLNEQEDEAIDAFVKAVQSDPDTTELHFALGNLFRRRGEYGRAVKVHEHLASRGDMARADHERALHALSQDYLRAGLLDRAENALRQLDGTRYEPQARKARLVICERSRLWEQAAQLAAQLEQQNEDQHRWRARRAHHWCEIAAQGTAPEARLQALEKALQIDPASVRARISLADHLHAKGDTSKALQELCAVVSSNPEAAGLVASSVATWSLELGGINVDRGKACLQAAYALTRSIDVLHALATLESDPAAERRLYAEHLQQTPSLLVAAKWMKGEKFEHEEVHPPVQRAVEKAAGPLGRYRCQSCGFEAHNYFWQCPGCQAWDSYSSKRVEEL
jgi:lipopolysaccharide biosynthesis regulator YciM